MRCKTKKRIVKSSRKRRSKSKKMRGSGRGSKFNPNIHTLTADLLGTPPPPEKSEAEKNLITAINEEKDLLSQAGIKLNDAVES